MPLSAWDGGTGLLAAVESLPFGVATADVQGILTWANAAYAQLTDCTPDELIGRSAGEFPWAVLAHAAPSSEPWRGQATCQRKTGASYTVEHSVTALRDHGEVTGFWIVKRDISGLKPDQPRPNHAEASLRALIESSDDLIWSVDPNFGLVTFNKASRDHVERNFGVRPAVGMRPHDYLTPEVAALWPPLYQRGFSEGAFRGEFLLADGRTLELAINPIRQGGETTGLSVFGKDITERKNAERTLQEAENKYRSIFETAVEGIYRVSMEGKTLAANPALAKLLGYESAEEAVPAVADTAHQVWLDPDDRSRFLALLKERGLVLGYPCQLKRKDGTAIWVSLSSRIVSDSAGQALYTEGFVEDITERKRAEETLRQANQAVARAERHYHRLFNSVSDAILVFQLKEDGLSSRCVDVNDNACRLLGYTRAELLRLRVNDIDPPENYSDAPAIVQALFSEGSLVREQTLLTKDGRRLPVEISTHVFDLDGSPTMISSVRDTSDRHAAQARLQAQHQRFKSIIENSDAGYFRIGMDGCYEEVNPAWLRMHGFTRKEEAIGLHFSAVQNPEDLAKAEEVATAIMGRESIRGGEFSRMRRDGTVGYHTFSANPVLDGDRVIGIEGFLVDTSDQRTADQARRHTEELYRSLFNSVNEGVALHRLVSADGAPTNYILLDVNRRYEEILGVRREHVANRLATDVYATADAPYLKEYASVVETGEPLRFETHFAPMDKHFVISVARMGDQQFATIFFDVTEQKRTQQALQRAGDAIVKAERHYRLMFNSGSDAVLVYKLGEDGLPGPFLEANDNACSQLGYTREELLRMKPFEIDSPDEHAGIAVRAQALATEGHFMWEGVHIAKDGRRIPVEVNSHLVDLDGSQTIISCVRNITERKEAETAKASLEEQLRQAQKLESVCRLAGGVAHDFNNLLTVINGYSDLLLRRLKSPDPLHQYAEEIRRAGERAAGLTRQLLAFSRKQIIEPRVLNLGAVIAESAPMLQRLIGEDVALETHLDASLGQVMADPDQLHQVLMNLAVNARDAMPDGGKLRIVTSNVDLGPDSTAVQSGGTPGQYVLMSVSDTGHGMDAAVRQQIFEPFFTTKELGRGTGLGLSTVYGIIRQSGGWIEVSSEVGVGSSFVVYLPRIDACPVPEKRRDAALAEGGGETILVVEDQEAVRSFATTTLEAYGYHVIAAVDGEEAFAVAEAHPERIDLLLVDVVLPGINGRELAERLRALRPDLKVLFVSGYPADVIAQRGVLERGVAFLRKPFTPDQLAAKVRGVLAPSPI